ncbi:DUF397 domain-containing protein [Micromonospora craterilacus]|uniref:DUF397 domain-containing protein n=1 Tax=Micromonospora craterilacus TaxID=1655439 RepID=A0A2W2EI03_9ACTN|nr:DUF397 domain-containing protein [Micromonospora craterilacus]PZG16539.1 DUF397 domain-containing protein [Micromonospora craterilacus]
MTEQIFTNWRKSTRSSGGGNCVEVADSGALVGIRDTKDRAGGTLVISSDAWGGFIDAVRCGELSPA